MESKSIHVDFSYGEFALGGNVRDVYTGLTGTVIGILVSRYSTPQAEVDTGAADKSSSWIPYGRLKLHDGKIGLR